MRAHLLRRIIQSSTCAKTPSCYRFHGNDVTPFTRIQSADGWSGVLRAGTLFWSWWRGRSLKALPPCDQTASRLPLGECNTTFRSIAWGVGQNTLAGGMQRERAAASLAKLGPESKNDSKRQVLYCGAQLAISRGSAAFAKNIL